MKHFMLFAILVISGASAQPLLFIREDAEPYKGHASAIEDAVDQPTGMQPETAAMPVALTSVVCPGGQYRCPDGTTCCKSGTKWACCPYPQVNGVYMYVARELEISLFQLKDLQALTDLYYWLSSLY